MRQVICVKPIAQIAEIVKHCPYPQVGDIDTVTEVYEEFGAWYYCLQGYPQDHIFKCDCFATLPSTTEEIAVECEQEAIIYQR